MLQEDASDWLPAWIVLGRWVVLPVGVFVASVALTRILERVLAKAPADAGALAWPENAYALQRVIAAPFVGVLVAGGILGIVADVFRDDALPPRGLLALTVLSGFAAVLCERKRLTARHGGLRLGWVQILRTRLGLMSLGYWLPYVVVALVVLCRHADPYPRVRFAAGALLLLFLWFGGALRLALLVVLVRPAGEHLRASVGRVAARASIEPPSAFEVEMVFPNAFALSTGDLVVTSAALERLDEAELEAVVAHELGHLRERRWLALLGVPWLAAAFFVLWAVTLAPETSAWWWLALSVGLLAFRLVLPRVLRAAERRADAFAHAHADAARLASALETMHRALLLPPKLGPVSTHPDLAERQLAAGVTPGAGMPPRRPRRRAAAFFVLLGASVGLGTPFARDALTAPDPGPLRARVLLALRGPEPFSLACLAEDELARERPRAAHALFRAGALLEPANPWWTMQETVALLRAGDCAAARERLAESERRSAQYPPEDSAEWYAWARAAVANCR